jgi:hypothetical protein
MFTDIGLTTNDSMTYNFEPPFIHQKPIVTHLLKQEPSIKCFQLDTALDRSGADGRNI